MIPKRNIFGGPVGLGKIRNPRVSKKNMNSKQAKARFPHMNPYGDCDHDGVKNKFDCHPFDRKRQDDYKPMTEEERQEEYARMDKKALEEKKLKAYLKKNPYGKFDKDFE